MSEEARILQESVSAIPWKETLAEIRPQEAFRYGSALSGLAFQDGSSPHPGWHALARFFFGNYFIVSAHPKKRGKDSEQDPTSPPWFLTRAELDLAETLVGAWDDPEFVARLGDILWIRRKKQDLARRAAMAYVASAERLFDPEHWTYSEERFRRALELALAVDAKGATVESVVASITTALERLEGTDPYYFSLRLASLLDSHNLGDRQRMAELLESRGLRGGQPDLEKHSRNSEYLEAAARLWRKVGDKESESRCLRNAAEEMANHAEGFHSQGPGARGAAPHWMKVAIKLMRQVHGEEARVAEMHHLMLAWEEESMQDMVSFSHKTEIPQELVQAMSEVVSGSFPISVAKLATAFNVVSMSELRVFAEQEVKSPLFALLPPAFLRADGKLDERVEGIPLHGPVPEATMRKLMHHTARICWQVRAGMIDLAIGAIQRAYAQEEMDLRWLVVRSKFIPEDRRGIFKRGLEAGFRADLELAMHLLVPQVENSLRHLLRQVGEITSRLDADDTEDEHLLSRLLDNAKLAEIIGEDTVFDLRGLLNERPGANLRNELAHGMVNDYRLHQADCLYLWWLILRLCFLKMDIPSSSRGTSSSPP